MSFTRERVVCHTEGATFSGNFLSTAPNPKLDDAFGERGGALSHEQHLVAVDIGPNAVIRPRTHDSALRLGRIHKRSIEIVVHQSRAVPHHE
jgi:hypothetical protein